jgi:hypothetical protein
MTALTKYDTANSVTSGGNIMRPSPARAADTSLQIDPVSIFRLRCEARAYLWSCGELHLHEAVDGLQDAALRDGLVALIGQDQVQAIMALAFVDRPEIIWTSPPSPFPSAEAARSTVEALVFELRERGVRALARANCQRRLADLSIAQLKSVIGRLRRLQPHYPAIDADLLSRMERQL